MKASTLLNTAAFLLLLLLASTSSAMGQSGCKVLWIFKLPCAEPAGAIVNQVKAWSQRKCFGSQEKCKYELIQVSPTSLEIKHTSPRTHKTTDITFKIYNPSAPKFCKIKGFATSSSKNATDPNDYCLIYNLFDGSGLTEAQGYKEICSDTMCPARVTALCKH